MRIDPELRALRGDIASQRKAQKALEAARDSWRQGPARTVLNDLEVYGAGTPLEACGALSTLMEDGLTAHRLVDDLIRRLLDSLRAHALGHVPLRHQHAGGLSVLQLAHSGRAALTLLTYGAHDFEPAPSVCFAGGERQELVLAGAGDIQMLEMVDDRGTSAAIDCQARRVVAGEVIRCSRYVEARSLRRVHGRLVMLRLARADALPCDAREFALTDGRLLHRANGSRAESRHEMMLALLGRMGRRDAAPLIAEMTREGSDHIRWQALRESLALDSGTGFAALGAVARNVADPLSSTAAALCAQLLETHPRLAQVEQLPCPA